MADVKASKCPTCKVVIESVEDHILEKHRGIDLEELLEKIRAKWYGRGRS